MTGCRVEPLDAPLTVRIDRAPLTRSPGALRAMDEAWRGLVASNPRYFDGPILSYESRDGAAARARLESFRAHACRDALPPDERPRYFGITGVLCAASPDAPTDGQPRYMLARRGEGVHNYPGMWEFGPCGGIDPPATGDHLTPDDLAAELRREAHEELGLDLGGAPMTHLALVHDTPQVGSTDLMVLVRLPRIPPAAGASNWEVAGVRWRTLDELAAWADERPGEIIPTTRAMIAWWPHRPGCDKNAAGGSRPLVWWGTPRRRRKVEDDQISGGDARTGRPHRAGPASPARGWPRW